VVPTISISLDADNGQRTVCNDVMINATCVREVGRRSKDLAGYLTDPEVRLTSTHIQLTPSDRSRNDVTRRHLL